VHQEGQPSKEDRSTTPGLMLKKRPLAKGEKEEKTKRLRAHTKAREDGRIKEDHTNENICLNWREGSLKKDPTVSGKKKGKELGTVLAEKSGGLKPQKKRALKKNPRRGKLTHAENPD